MTAPVLALVVLVALADAGEPVVVDDAGAGADAGAAATKDPLADLPAANPISFKAAIEKAVVGLAEPFRLTIEVRHAADETYTLPEGLDLKAFGIRERTTQRAGEDPAVTTVQLVLQAFDLGDQEVPTIRLRVDGPAGVQQLEIPPQKVQVEGIIDPAQGEPKMREDTRPLPTHEQPIWWPFLFVLVPLALWGAWALSKSLQAKRALPPPPKPRSAPDVEALERLALLEREALPAQGRVQEHFFRVSEIVRDYVGRRYGFEALELTTDELLAKVRRTPTPGLPADALAAFLQQSDLVKFARQSPTDGESKAAVEVARSIVEKSRPPPPTEPGKAS